MSTPEFVVGIDLGTTHCVVAESPADRGDIRILDIPQLVAPGEVAKRSLLPSTMYLPAAHELSAEQMALPWASDAPLVGVLAQQLGAKVPNSLVASAKSWICHGGVNRKAPILPWSAPDGAPHVSPFDAQCAYLRHLRAAWESEHRGLSLADQDVVVTVPASFDEDARELTQEAAHTAGLGSVRLLEEPQAAFYDFMGAHSETLQELLGDARLILVVDVGGGTTDLTLLQATPSASPETAPQLERIAVGGHLMLGGDNMDAALAHHVLQKAGISKKLDPSEWAALVQSARQTKERLLAAAAPAEAVVSIQQRGSRLLSGTRSVTVSREEVDTLLLDGFLPFTERDATAGRQARAGLTTLGLPYATDPAIPRHISDFLRKHVRAAEDAGAPIEDGLPKPDLLLLNGGVFNAPAAAKRLTAVVNAWFAETDAVRQLPYRSLDVAVSSGAARYGLVRRGLGQLITGGTPRAYYIGVDGPEGAPRALCIAPRGLEDGDRVDLSERTFELVLNRTVTFPLFSYAGDRSDAAGELVSIDAELHPLPPVRTALRAKDGQSAQQSVPVSLSASLDESGTLQIHLTTVTLPPQRWRLELDLRAQSAAAQQTSASTAPEQHAAAPAQAQASGEARATTKAPLPPRFADARKQVEKAFAEEAPDKAKTLRKDLEQLLGPRGEWSARVCRALWDVLMPRANQRRLSATHELEWLRLTGWTLRPGYGAPDDSERIEKLWHIHDAGLHHRSKANWSDWWIMWRRVAGGLSEQQQRTLFEDIRPWLSDAEPPPGPKAHGPVEMLQLLAALEDLAAAQKEAAGEWFLQRTKKVSSWWPLGRLGARELVRAGPEHVVAPAVAERWLQRLLQEDWQRAEGATFAATLMARVSDDPKRDVSVQLRRDVVARLKQANAPHRWVEMVERTTELSERDNRRVFGDSLPVGLRLRA